jgi:uncharacterized protein YndB with AHSA1/START domain
MLIRRPCEEVYEAFINPEITSRFWFTHSSGRLDGEDEIIWKWGMYGVTTPVKVRYLHRNEKIIIDWGDPAITVEWTFVSRSDDMTFVEIRSSGFAGNADESVAAAIDTADGFALVLSGAKLWLERGLLSDFIGDRHPDGI